MKCFILVFLGLSVWVGSIMALDSPLTAEEQALTFSKDYLRTDDQGHGYLLVQGEPFSTQVLLSLSPWDLMDLVQTLANDQLPLSRFGDGGRLTQAWRQKLVAFAATADVPKKPLPEDLFDPALVLWDPGYIQTKNAWGQWSIRIANRDIVQSDIPTLSPLEVQQAVEVLTGRTYPIRFVLDHLEQFRAQISITPRSPEAIAESRRP
jgi:hypothetical protein